MALRRPSVFICYAREDHEACLALRERLAVVGVVAHGDWELVGGDRDFDIRLRQLVAGSTAFAVLLDDSSSRSLGCRKEMGWAIDDDKLLLPVQLDPSFDGIDLPERLKLVQWITAGPREEQFGKLMEALRIDTELFELNATVRPRALAWSEAKRGELLTAPLLRKALLWLKRSEADPDLRPRPTPPLQAYVTASRRFRFRVRLAAGFLVSLAGSGVYYQIWKAREQRMQEQGRKLGEIALSQLKGASAEVAPVLAAAAMAGWRLGPSSHAWNVLQRLPMISSIGVRMDDRPRATLFPLPGGATVVKRSSEGQIWVAAVDGEKKTSLPVGSPGSATAAASPDGRVLATGGDDGTVALWRTADATAILPLGAGAGPVRALRFSWDGRFVGALRGPSRLTVWDAETGATRVDVDAKGEPSLVAVGTAADGKPVAAYAIDGGRERRSQIHIVGDHGHTSGDRDLTPLNVSPVDLTFSPNAASLTVAEDDGVVRMISVEDGWEATNLPEPPPTLCQGGPHDSGWRVALSPDGRSAARSWSNGDTCLFPIRVSSVADRDEVVMTREGIAGPVAFSPDGKILMTVVEQSSDAGIIERVDLWAFDAGDRDLGRFDVGINVNALAFLPGGRKVAFSVGDGSVEIVDVESGRPSLHFLRPRLADEGDRARAAVCAQGNLVGSLGADGHGHLWSLDGTLGENGLAVPGSDAIAAMTLVAGTDHLAVLRANGTLQRWTLKGSELKLAAPEVPRSTTPGVAAFDPSGEFLISSRDLVVDVISVANGRTVKTFESLPPPGGGDPIQVAVDAKSTHAAVGFRHGIVRVLELSDKGRETREIKLVTSEMEISDLRFSADGLSLAIATSDGVVRLIDPTDGRELARIQHGTDETRVAFGEGRLATTGKDGSIRFYDGDLESLPRRFCQGIGRNLSPDEWRHAAPLDGVAWRRTCDAWPDASAGSR